MFYIKKTNRHFDNKWSVINHIRSIYPNVEEAYLSEFNINKRPKCKFCKNDCKFNGYFVGYSDICTDRICVRKKYIITNNKIAADKKIKQQMFDLNKIRAFIIKNIDFYIQNEECKSITDLYTNEFIGNISLRSFLSRKYSSDIFIVLKICKYCKKTYKNDILKHGLKRDWCRKKICVSLNRNGYNNTSTALSGSRELNNYYLSSKTDISYNDLRQMCTNKNELKSIYNGRNIKSSIHWECPITKWIIPITPKTTIFQDYLIREKINIVEYFDTYLPKYIHRCKHCGGVYNIDYNFTGNIKSDFCNQRCYFDYKNKHPEKYEISEETKLKQSNTMRKKIANGEFTPNITNSWTHWNSIIYYNNKIFKFRSSWEACFWFSNRHLEYEKLRIKYVDYDNIQRIYIADFFDSVNKIVYEIKPRESWVLQKHKMQQIILYCQNNQYNFIWINENNILSYIDQTLFIEHENKKQLNKLLNGIKANKNKKNTKNC